MGTVFAILAGVIAVAAIVYVWRNVMADGGVGDRTPGSVMDQGHDVRRIDMGTHGYAAQQAHDQLAELGLTTRLVTLEQGAFGIGLGEHWYLVYNAEDEDQVRAVVDQYLDDEGEPFPSVD